MRTSHDWTIDSVKSLTLNDVKNYYKQGIVTQALYDEYCHLWQTSAPRYEVQACSCAECLERGTIR